MQTVLGVFTNRDDAITAALALEKMGFNAHDLSISFKTPADNMVGTKGGVSSSDTVSGLLAGSVIGGLAGLLLGLAAGAIPNVGLFLIGGPIATTFGLSGILGAAGAGAVVGIIIGGIIGWLANPGVSTNNSPTYTQTVAHAVVLAVPAAVGPDADRVRGVFEQNRAEQIRSVTG